MFIHLHGNSVEQIFPPALMFNYFGKDYFHYERFIKNIDFLSECSFKILSKVTHILYDKPKIIN